MYLVIFFIALVGLVFVLYMYVQRRLNNENDSPTPQVETVLESFMNELTLENERLMETIRNMQSAWKDKSAQYENRILILEQRLTDLETRLQGIHHEKEQTGTPVFIVPERYQKIHSLHEEGLSMEQIAKQLGIGIGVVQLVLSLTEKK
jgi:DNA-binding NarL/FixJ family response regulator